MLSPLNVLRSNLAVRHLVFVCVYVHTYSIGNTEEIAGMCSLLMGPNWSCYQHKLV